MNRVVIIGLVLLALIAGACAPAPTAAPAVVPTTAPAVAPTPAPPTAAPPTAGKPIKVGLLSDQSGTLAIYGPMLENGATLGIEYATGGTNTVAGRPIQVIIKDTASKADVGTQVARDLIEKENVDLLIGPPNSGVAVAVNELAKQYKKIVIHMAASPDMTGKNFNPYVFRTGRTNGQDALVMGVALTQMGKTFVQIAPDYSFGYGGAASFYDVVKANGGQFVINDTPDKWGAIFIPQDAKDFTPYLQKVLDTKAQVLIITWAGAGFVPLFTQMQQMGVFKQMVVGTGMGDNQSLKSSYSPAIGSVGITVYHYTLPKNPINDWLVQHHKQKYGVPPELFTETGFTVGQMIVEGLKATNGDPDPDKLAKVFENNFTFDGPKGKYTVRPYDHVMLQTLYLVKLTNVTDPDFKFFDLVKEFKGEESAPPCLLEGDYKSRCPK